MSKLTHPLAACAAVLCPSIAAAQSFQNSNIATLADLSYDIGSADLNGDGRPDLVAGQLASTPSGPGRFSVILNSPGGFSAPAQFLLPNGVQSLAPGDFTNDGVPDAVFGMAGQASTTIFVKINNGAASFIDGAQISPGLFISSVAVADLNGDNKLDVAATDYNSGKIIIVFGNGAGGFSGPPIQYSPANASNPLSARIADLDLDGLPDLAVAESAVGSGIQLMKNQGAGTFQFKPPAPGSAQVTKINVCDLNRDGRTDIIATDNNFTQQGLRIFRNSGAFSFAPSSIFPYLGIQLNIISCDLNNDGAVDVVTGPSDSSGFMNIFKGNVAGGFSPVVSMPAGGGQRMSLVARDMDLDGDADIAYSQGASVNLLKNLLLAPAGATQYGSGTPGCSGTLTLGVNLPPKVNTPNFGVSCNHAPPFAMGFCIFGDAASFAGYDGFLINALIHVDLVASSGIGNFLMPSHGDGSAFGVLRIPNDPLFANAVIYVQAMFAEPASNNCTAATGDIVTSRGLMLTIAP